MKRIIWYLLHSFSSALRCLFSDNNEDRILEWEALLEESFELLADNASSIVFLSRAFDELKKFYT